MKSLLLSCLLLGLGIARAEDPKPVAPATAPTATRNVNVEKFDQLRQGTNVIVLDVRTSAEFAEGHLKDAVLLDYRSPDFAEKVAKLDKKQLYLVHCASGGRSARACAKMETWGFTNLVNLEGGYSAWKEAGKPVAK